MDIIRSMMKGGEATAGGRYPPGVEEGDEEVAPGLLYIKRDGRVVRPAGPGLVPANSQFVNGVASKDVAIDTANGLWGRVYLPESVAKKGKAPVVVFYHGGGFSVLSPDFELCARLCEDVARVSEVVVVTMSYRLAPEHRLPAAYEDAFTSILWLQKQAEGEGDEPWLIHHADFGACFVMGESAGGNIVHHLGVRFSKTDLHPLSIRGLIFLVPFFGKEERTESELLYGADDPIAPSARINRSFELALPVGANRDHPYSNVFGQALPVAKALIIVGKKDPLYSCQAEYCDALRGAGRKVEVIEVPDGGHGFRFVPEFASEVQRYEEAIRAFIHEATDSV